MKKAPASLAFWGLKALWLGSSPALVLAAPMFPSSCQLPGVCLNGHETSPQQKEKDENTVVSGDSRGSVREKTPRKRGYFRRRMGNRRGGIVGCVLFCHYRFHISTRRCCAPADVSFSLDVSWHRRCPPLWRHGPSVFSQPGLRRNRYRWDSTSP